MLCMRLWVCNHLQLGLHVVLESITVSQRLYAANCSYSRRAVHLVKNATFPTRHEDQVASGYTPLLHPYKYHVGNALLEVHPNENNRITNYHNTTTVPDNSADDDERADNEVETIFEFDNIDMSIFDTNDNLPTLHLNSLSTSPYPQGSCLDGRNSFTRIQTPVSKRQKTKHGTSSRNTFTSE